MRVLLVQTSFLGDTVLSTPVIAGLKMLYPDAELWMLTTPAGRQLVERDPLLKGVITFDKRRTESGVLGLWRKARALRRFGFSKAYSLHRSARTSVLLAWAGIPERVGFKEARFSSLYTRRLPRSKSDHDVQRNLSILADFAQSEKIEQEMRLFAPPLDALSEPVRQVAAQPGYVLLSPGSTWYTKMWSWQRYREVAVHYLKMGQRVVVSGAPEEESVADKVCEGISAINLAGATSLAEQLALVEHAGLVICNDSLILHVASAFKRPTVAIFCATSPTFGFGPWRSPARVVEMEGLSCKPCRRHGGKFCPTGTEACMNDLSSQKVLAAAREVFPV